MHTFTPRVTGRRAPRLPVITTVSLFLLLNHRLLFLSSEKVQVLHTELDSVQALRRQLEEVLARTRSLALGLERAAKRQPDFGGGDGQGPASRAAGGTVTNTL